MNETLQKKSQDTAYMLEKVSHLILESIDTKDSKLREMALCFAENKGKMLRPALTLYCGLLHDLEKAKLKQLWTAAAGIELLHMSALIHDDILDRATMRRGMPSVNAMYGSDMAILLGDYFYSRALNLLSDLPHTSILKMALNTIARMVEGEVMQKRHLFNFTMSTKDYIKIITYKTASLTSLSCYAGGKIANLPEEKIKLLVNFGINLGKAYQIRDDILDFLGDEDTLKKPSADIEQGIITLPIIFLLKMVNLMEKDQLKKEPLKIKAAKKAAEYCNRMLAESLNNLNEFPPSIIKENLEKIVKRVYVDI